MFHLFWHPRCVTAVTAELTSDTYNNASVLAQLPILKAMILLEVSSHVLKDPADVQSHNVIIHDVLTDRFEK